MYMHLGRDYVVNTRDIVGIFHLDTTTISPRGREFLQHAQKNGAVVSVADDLPKSYVLTSFPVETVFLSSLPPDILGARAMNPAALLKKAAENVTEASANPHF